MNPLYLDELIHKTGVLWNWNYLLLCCSWRALWHVLKELVLLIQRIP